MSLPGLFCSHRHKGCCCDNGIEGLRCCLGMERHLPEQTFSQVRCSSWDEEEGGHTGAGLVPPPPS